MERFVDSRGRNRSQSHRAVKAIRKLGLLLLTAVFALLERVSARIFEWESTILSSIPCGVFRVQESAILILGEADGLGRAAALSFSELGYTVFVLSTANSEPPSPTLSEKSSTVSSLLYAWHRKKERSPRASWGMLAPITLDRHSETQRAYASETVHAFCLNHGLHLVALVILPPSSPARCNPPDERHMHLPDKSSSTEGSLAFPMRDKEMVSSSLEPIAIVRDYFDLLMQASGRVVVMSRCLLNNREGVEGLLDGTLECLATNLGWKLKSSGVRVCYLSIGAPEDFNVFHEDGDAADEILSLLRRGLSIFSGSFSTSSGTREKTVTAPYHALVCKVLEEIAFSPYPKYSYTVGFRPWLHYIWRMMPDTLKVLL